MHTHSCQHRLVRGNCLKFPLLFSFLFVSYSFLPTTTGASEKICVSTRVKAVHIYFSPIPTSRDASVVVFYCPLFSFFFYLQPAIFQLFWTHVVCVPPVMVSLPSYSH